MKSSSYLMLSQFIGASVGCLIIYSTINFNETIESNIAILKPGLGAFYGRVFISDLIGTFILCSLILAVKYHNGAREPVYNCFIVFMGLFGLIVMTNKVSGACYNPAVAIP